MTPYPRLIARRLALWAQTVRMRLIPEDLHGRVFALLRTVMLAGPALGGLIGAQLVGNLAVAGAVTLVVASVVLPGIGALLRPALLSEALPLPAIRPGPRARVM